MKRAVVLAALLVLLATGAAAASFQGDLKSLRVNDTAIVNATITNPLPVGDTIDVTFRGDAIERGLIMPDYPSAYCTGNICRVDVDPESSRDIAIPVEATAIGQDELIGVANSTTTRLSSTDQLEVRVGPNFAGVTVSAPGISGMHVLVVSLLGAAMLYFTRL